MQLHLCCCLFDNVVLRFGAALPDQARSALVQELEACRLEFKDGEAWRKSLGRAVRKVLAMVRSSAKSPAEKKALKKVAKELGQISRCVLEILADTDGRSHQVGLCGQAQRACAMHG